MNQDFEHMSRLGKIPITIPEGTQVSVEKDFIIVKSSKGELKQRLHKLVNVDVQESSVIVKPDEKVKSKKEKAFWGLYWSLINNMITGVNEGFEKKLEIIGVGYRAAVNGGKLVLNVGYSHPVDFEMPEGITATVEANVIKISGVDKQLVGEVSANIRKIRKPEPYKGKGIKYADEIIRRKEGKTAAKGQ